MGGRRRIAVFCLGIVVVTLLISCSSAPVRTVVYETRSAFERIYVVEKGEVRCLRFGSPSGDDQSCISLKDPDTVVLEYLARVPIGLALAGKLRRMLMIGLGGGSLVRLLLPRVPELRMTVVEIDPVVVDVARKYFGVSASERLTIVVQDGRRYVEGCRERFDAIVLVCKIPY